MNYLRSKRPLLAAEQEASAQWAASMDAETLTTDTHGARSAEWFRETGSAFATGIASTCFVFGIVHPEIGMAAAHLNTVTHDDFRKILQTGFKNPSLIQSAAQLSEAHVHKLIVSPQSLERTIKRAVNLALGEFDTLTSNGIPQDNTLIMTCGLDWLDPVELQTVNQGVIQIFRSQPQMHDGRQLERARHIDYGSFLGRVGGIIYGGSTHPVYNSPALYQFS